MLSPKFVVVRSPVSYDIPKAHAENFSTPPVLVPRAPVCEPSITLGTRFSSKRTAVTLPGRPLGAVQLIVYPERGTTSANVHVLPAGAPNEVHDVSFTASIVVR
jgi:hypothetical protein